jgi:hypothetical protein
MLSFVKNSFLGRNPILRMALLVGLVGHGLVLPFTFENTYDAFVHIFFADHYANDWFNLWETRWYTGFAVSSYPPLVHQIVALFSCVVGLKVAFWLWAMVVMALFIIGSYRFARLFVNEKIASYTAIAACFTPSIIQVLHIYGQLPTLTGIAFLLNALPDLYAYVRFGHRSNLYIGLSLIAVTVASHHVTPLFGMVFFIAPLTTVAVFDQQAIPLSSFKDWWTALWKNRVRLIILFGAIILLLVTVVWPYWSYAHTNPITQVPIPHGSRDSFLEVPSSGKMFFLLPYGFILLMLPFIFRQYFSKRLFFFGISLTLMVLLGTGGTTPLPRFILGDNAFNILTLDRFTFWATILCMPFVAQWMVQLKATQHRLLIGFASILIILQTGYLVHLGRFQTLQPNKIKMQPIINFLATDQHNRWRYMTLGFGDQMAWLTTLTPAQSIDGNYHSARQLPELTHYPIERLENSKHKGVESLKSLREILVQTDKYSLKYIFSNDKFYDPLLYFLGWERAIRLSNGIVVWEKPDVPPLSMRFEQTHRLFPLYERLLWGLLPLLTLLWAVSMVVYFHKSDTLNFNFPKAKKRLDIQKIDIIWVLLLSVLLGYIMFKNRQNDSSPEQTLRNYLNDTDFRFFDRAYSHFAANRLPYESYLLELSVNDGLLASYSKLDSVYVLKTEQKNDTTLLHSKILWRTAMGQFVENKIFKLLKEGNEWKFCYEMPQNVAAPDRVLQNGYLSVFSHGKRKVSPEPAPADDILDRPEIVILNANLVQNDTAFAIVGELKNTEYLPASVSIEGLFLDNQGSVLDMASAETTIIHKLLPQETTPFRIDFKGKKPPVNFKIMARAVVTTGFIYRGVGYQNVTSHDGLIKGNLLNHGSKTATVTSLLATSYDDGGQGIIWVSAELLPENIRVQQSTDFEIQTPYQQHIKIIKKGEAAQFLVNGMDQNEYSQAANPAGFSIKIHSFIGNDN